MDLLDLHRGRLSWRRLRILIQGLPAESRTMTAMRNAMTAEELAALSEQGEPEKGRWSQTEQLLAVVADRIAELTYAYSTSHTEKGKKKPRRPDPIRRPGVQQAKPKQQINDEQADTLFRLINGGAA
ncbi:hypothetical protein [Streptomyces sp. NPDC059786]|uniref:hypothetical protein n=1 Tax=Streptomyces sp. NPDC059786 TaxID=3346946 RepID=UPI00366671F6